MPSAYALRDGGDGKNKKQSMADLKLRRLNELNLRLKEDLDRPRIKVAEASMSYVELATPQTSCTLANDLLQPRQLLQFDPRLYGTVCLGPNRQKGGSIHASTGRRLLQCHVSYIQCYCSRNVTRPRARGFCNIEQGVEYGCTAHHGIAIGH
jgi:hypothetical protein